MKKIDIRPKTLGITPQKTDNGTIAFTLERPAYFIVEPIKNYNIDTKDENVIYFGKGEHDIGEIELKSNQTLFIDEGAVVYACVKAADADNIRILGRGILDNSRNKEEILFEYNAENNNSAINNATRQHTLQLEYCTDIEIDGITIRDSSVYNIRPIGCKNLHIANV